MQRKYIAKIRATHAGYVNHNNVLYPEKDVADAVKTWLEPFNKPLLRHHEVTKDPIGRIIDAKYVPMVPGEGNKPKGFIELTVEVNDADAVEKIKDRRYNTVSIGAKSEYVSCSACGQVLSEDGLCEHKKGSIHDGKKVYWNVGKLRYVECSFVNAPADEYAATVSLEEIPIMTIANGEQTKDKEENLKFTFDDSDNQDIQFTEDDIALAGWLMVELEHELGDATLSAAKRKELPASTFCGPGKSFPVEMGAGIKDGLNGETLTHNGDGNPVRYLNYSDILQLIRKRVETGNLNSEFKSKISEVCDLLGKTSNIIRHPY